MEYQFEREWGYFEWLCSTVHIDQDERSYRILAGILHEKPFYSIIPHDENRGSDGLGLRDEYLRYYGYPKYYEFDMEECSVLEMMIALARRMNYEVMDPYDEPVGEYTTYWFWEMIDNLGLIGMSDDCYGETWNRKHVDIIVKRLLERRYKRNGIGGLFPLRESKKDQRKIELWYQASNYLAEQEAG